MKALLARRRADLLSPEGPWAELGFSPEEALLARASARELSEPELRLAQDFAAEGDRPFLREFLLRPTRLWGAGDDRSAFRAQERLSYFSAELAPRSVLRRSPGSRWAGKLGWLAAESWLCMALLAALYAAGSLLAAARAPAPIVAVASGCMVGLAALGPFACPFVFARLPWLDLSRARLQSWVYSPERRAAIRAASLAAAEEILGANRTHRLRLVAQEARAERDLPASADFELGGLIDAARHELIVQGQDPAERAAAQALAQEESLALEALAARAPARGRARL